MSSSPSTGTTEVMPQFNLWAEIRLRYAALLKLLVKRGFTATVTIFIILATLALPIFGFGWYQPVLYRFTHRGTNSQTHAVLPNIIQSSSVHDCTAAYSQSNQAFSNCPSYIIDFSNTATLAQVLSGFNVYTGAPVANDEAEYYSNSSPNLHLNGGSLVLEAKNQKAGVYDFTSARIDTHDKEDFLYGKIVVRAKMPSGVGTWPAIWLLPSQATYASLSPTSDQNRFLNDGEIDIAEAIGTQPNVIYGITHTLSSSQAGFTHQYYNTVRLPNDYTSYNDYELDWTPTSLTYLINGQAFFTYNKSADADWQSWPFNQPMYLVMNLALGGTWGGNDTKDYPGTGVNPQALPTALDIQSVRYYSYNGN